MQPEVDTQGTRLTLKRVSMTVKHDRIGCRWAQITSQKPGSLFQNLA
jgi:hypothetical protein